MTANWNQALSSGK